MVESNYLKIKEYFLDLPFCKLEKNLQLAPSTLRP